MMPRRSSLSVPTEPRRRPTVAVGLLALLLLTLNGGCAESVPSATDSQPLIVYCAHDAAYSDPIFKRFTRETGIQVQVRHDTEATKSLGLVNRLIREKSSPTCDVFWNNQVLGTTDLLSHDILASYKGNGWTRIPDAYKDPDGRWCGFAARFRVWIVNTDKMSATTRAIDAAAAGSDLSRMAIARPLFGTTLTHYCLLWHADAGATLKAWHTDARQRGLIEVPGNSTVKNLVARGACDLGWTDTDDFFVGRDNQHPVAMLPVRLPGGQTICMPNSVAIIRGTSRLAAARRLVDFLLSAKTELALAHSASRQVPLGKVDVTRLPREVQELQPLVEQGAQFGNLEASRTACLAWLRNEYKR